MDFAAARRRVDVARATRTFASGKALEDEVNDAFAEAREEIEAAIADAVKSIGADSIRDMGKVMGALKAKYTGQIDFGAVGPMVKDRLSS